MSAQASEACKWCESKAVPAACLEATHADALPKGVFWCAASGASPMAAAAKVPPGGPGASASPAAAGASAAGFSLPTDFDDAVNEALGGAQHGPSMAGAPPVPGGGGGALRRKSAYAGKRVKIDKDNREKLEAENKAMMDQLKAERERVEKETLQAMQVPPEEAANVGGG